MNNRGFAANVRSGAAGVSAMLVLVLLCALPLVGVWLGGQPVARYLQFPPLTAYVTHAPFAWSAFAALCGVIAAMVGPFIFRRFAARSETSPAVPRSAAQPFPWWGWVGLAFGVVAWTLAWTRFEWFRPFQPHTFAPLWLAYIVVVNALTWRRSGHCMLLDRPRHFGWLFVGSAAFWWFFEYLNRFVQNWYYVGISQFSPLEYILFASVSFATVLPAVMGTAELLDTFPALSAGWDRGRPVHIRCPRTVAVVGLALSAAGLAAIGLYPDWLFPLLWLAPLLILVSVNALRNEESVVSPLARGDWRRVAVLALSALICGFFWELWNFRSTAKWIYTVPFVNRFHIFEMPVLGYAGYLPFGLECAVVADAIARWQKRPAPAVSRGPRIARLVLCLLIAAVLWMTVLHVFFAPSLRQWRQPVGMPPMAEALARRHLALWSSAAARETELRRMRGRNAEWDFMGRTFFVLALSNIGMRQPELRPQCLAVMDLIIGETVRLEAEHGQFYFLMDYARDRPFVAPGGRSVFVDGEIALMAGARCLLEDSPTIRKVLDERIAIVTKSLSDSPVVCAESYPDECWVFCNVVALTAIRMSDVLSGSDHRPLFSQWLDCAKTRLMDSRTGLLISSFSYKGEHFDGPEGSTLWLVAHCLQTIAPEFAADQYRRARKELGRTFLGFGYAQEWPDSWEGPADIDSGPIIPGFKISAGSSGLAVLGAAAFGDDRYLKTLLTSLRFGGFPEMSPEGLRFHASNGVGDAVLLYALVQGPLWERMRVGSTTESGRGAP